MTFSNGSLILVDFTGKVKDTDEIFDTTSEEVAKQNSLHDPSLKYQPRLVSIGEPSYPVLKGFDEALAKGSIGEKLTVEVTPEKGFGERDPGKIRMIPLRKLGEDAEKVSVGDTIELDGKRGIVRFIGSGRVQIDYNHRFAGKTIIYEATIVKSLESANDKIDGILKDRLPVENSKISFELSNDEVTVPIPESIIRMDGLQALKHIIQMDIFKFVPNLKKVNFVETYINKKLTSKNDQNETKSDTKNT